MMSESNNKNVLVLLSTGKLGSGIVDAFVQAKYNVFGTTRGTHHPDLESKGVTPVPFLYGDKHSIERALDIAKPKVIVVITSYQAVAKSLEAEVMHGKVILDAAKEAKVPHVILTSSHLSECDDDCPVQAYHMTSKKKIEGYMKELDLPCYSILRASSFFENFDDPTVHNPLCRGYLRDLYGSRVRVGHVSTFDIGKAAVAMARNPENWSGKSLPCVVSVDTGDCLAKTLADVSGMPVVYQATPPRLLLKLMMPYLFHMVDYYTRKPLDKDVWSKKIEEFKNVVPDVMSFDRWLLERQQTWSDGTRFGETIQHVSRKHHLSKLIVGIAAVLAVCYGSMYGI